MRADGEQRQSAGDGRDAASIETANASDQREDEPAVAIGMTVALAADAAAG